MVSGQGHGAFWRPTVLDKAMMTEPRYTVVSWEVMPEFLLAHCSPCEDKNKEAGWLPESREVGPYDNWK